MAEAVPTLLDPESFYAKVAGTVGFCRFVIDEPDLKVVHSRVRDGRFEVDGVKWHGIVVPCGAPVHHTSARIDGRDHHGWAAQGMSWIKPAGSRLSWHREEASEVLCVWLDPQRYDRLLRDGRSDTTPELAPRFPSADPVVEYVVIRTFLPERAQNRNEALFNLLLGRTHDPSAAVEVVRRCHCRKGQLRTQV
jgi:hypothetical protein